MPLPKVTLTVSSKVTDSSLVPRPVTWQGKFVLHSWPNKGMASFSKEFVGRAKDQLWSVNDVGVKSTFSSRFILLNSVIWTHKLKKWQKFSMSFLHPVTYLFFHSGISQRSRVNSISSSVLLLITHSVGEKIPTWIQCLWIILQRFVT